MHLGISKTTFNTSISSLVEGRNDLEIFLTERVTREKASGKWPFKLLETLSDKSFSSISHNRDISTVKSYEDKLNQLKPFYMLLEKKGLLKFSSQNEEVLTIGHHYAHALAAKFMSPFNESLIIVRDGAGNKKADLKSSIICEGENRFLNGDEQQNEMLSVYTLKNGNLECVDKQFQTFSFHNDISVSDGIGIMYEAVAEYIFNNKRAAGKVMGLAPFGTSIENPTVENVQNLLVPEKRFLSKGKCDWESSPHLDYYKNLAASMQKLFEIESLKYLKKLKSKYPKFSNIILTGGTALNCTFNMSLVKSELFENVYIPPFPGDECISLGCLSYSYYKENKFSPYDLKLQNGYFGPKKNSPNNKLIESLFQKYNVKKFNNVEKEAARLIADGHVLAWFQGRSESGPRALGNRSLLGPLHKDGLKDYLNNEIKFREDFRPYGGSFIDTFAHEYFNIPNGFLSPYMSFSLPIKENKKSELKEVTHVDFTSRAQVFTYNQNPRYFKLIEEVGKLTSIYGVLNTSLNIMGEPIVESLNDLLNFFEKSRVQYTCVGDYIIWK